MPTTATPSQSRLKVVRVTYKTLKKLISKADIDVEKFVTLPNRRMQKKATYKNVLAQLQNGESFDSPLVVNRLPDGTYEILDGSNRWDAIKGYIGLDPLNKVEATLIVYDNVDEQEKKDIYTKWSKGRPQTTNDVVAQYEKDIPILMRMQEARNGNQLPMNVSVYGGTSSFAFYRLISAYLTAVKEGNFQGGFSGSAHKFVNKAQELRTNDYNIIKAFLTDFLEAFGDVKKNSWAKTTGLTSMFRIWVDNKERLTSEQMIGYFRTKLRNRPEAEEYLKVSGMTATQFARRKIVQLLNGQNYDGTGGRQRNTFV